tara:strand:+ start:1746 stop:2582 length:837 start_codon:yes stop_codon:yes gene_type:complete
MKNVFTLSLFVLLTVSLSFAQGFEPPVGSTYNADSTEITLPSAYLEANYIDTIIFDIPDAFSLDIIDIPFNFAQITAVDTPAGMSYSCSAENCYFLPNTSGYVFLSGTPIETGFYELNLSALVQVDLTSLGIASTVTFSIPYIEGESLLLDGALGIAGVDPSVINEVIPTFFINVEPTENNPNLSIDSKNIENFDRFVVSPNPAAEMASFSFYNKDAKYLSLEIYDLLGNLMYADQFKGYVQSEQTYNVNTSSFNNGVYLYKLSTSNASHSGRLVVNK